MLIDIGRYFGAFAQNLQSFTIHTLDDLWRWRLIGILSTAGLAVYYLYIVSLRRPPSWQNACLSVAVFTLPTMQSQAVWVAMYAFWTPPMLLSLAAAHLLVKATDRDILVKVKDRYILADRPVLWRSARLTLLAFVSVLAACFFYPMSATVVLVPAAHLLLSENKQQYRHMAVLSAAVLGSAFVGLFVIHKLIVLPHLANVPYLGEYDYKLSGNLLTEATYRLGYYLREGAYLWAGLDIPLFPALVGVAAILAAIYCAIRVFRRSIGTSELLNVLIACGLFFVAVGPVLVVGQFSTTYRIRLGMNGIELLILFWLLRQLPIGSLRLASLFAVLGIGCSFVDVYGVSAVRSRGTCPLFPVGGQSSPRDFHSIAILRPELLQASIRLFLSSRFRYVWGCCRLRFSIFSSARDIMARQCSMSQHLYCLPVRIYRVAIERNDDKLPIGVEENAVVIDTSSIYGEPTFQDITGDLRPFPRDHLIRGAASGTDPQTPLTASTNTFWEIAGVPFPISLELEFPTAHTLTGYSLSTVEATERMPSSWEICVSSDRVNWRRLQEMTKDSHGGTTNSSLSP